MSTTPSDISAKTFVNLALSSTSSPVIQSSITSPSSSDNELGVRLKTLREAHGLSQRELAKRAAITNSSISMIEQGQVSPSVQSLARILNAFPMTLADFFSCNLALLNDCIFRAVDFEQAASPNTVGVLARALRRDSVQPQLDIQTQLFPVGFSGRIERSVSTQDWSGVIMQGALQLWVGAKCHELSVGDGFYIPRGIDCRVINPTFEEAYIVSCALFVRSE